MKPKSEKSIELYHILLRCGYPEDFCDQVTKNLNTDFTAQRMIGYLSHYQKLPPGEVVDEMLAILSDRNRIMQKKQMESSLRLGICRKCGRVGTNRKLSERKEGAYVPSNQQTRNWN